MPIRKRGAGWQVDVKVHGRRARQTVATKATAIELEARLREELERDHLGLSPRRTLEDALADYLDGPARALRAYDSLLYKARILRPYLTGRAIEHAPAAAAAIIRDDANLGRAAATTNRTLALLRRLCNLAYQWGWTSANVGQRIKLLPERGERHIYLQPEQVDIVAAWLRTRQREGEADAVILAAYTGLRRGELLRLEPDDYLDGVLRVAAAKSGKPRLVPVPSPAWDACTRLPLRCTASTLRDWFGQARDDCGLPHVHFHDLRHTYASWLIQAGANMQAVKNLLGHSTMQMTSRYAHLADEHLREAVSKIGSQAGHKGRKRIRGTAAK